MTSEASKVHKPMDRYHPTFSSLIVAIPSLETGIVFLLHADVGEM